MPPPVSTPEQREAARVKAAEVRQARVAIANQMRAGEINLHDIFENAGDPVYGKLRIKMVLGWYPGLGPVKIRELLETLDIDEKKYIRAFSEKQKAAILSRVV